LPDIAPYTLSKVEPRRRNVGLTHHSCEVAYSAVGHFTHRDILLPFRYVLARIFAMSWRTGWNGPPGKELATHAVAHILGPQPGPSKGCLNSNRGSEGESFVMSCRFCESGDEAEFTAEMIIHFQGLKNVDKPGVWIFPKLLVCLDCGSSQFTVPATELAILATDTGAKGASTP
jgi:hypothetical protein